MQPKLAQPLPPDSTYATLFKILDLARWAPSNENEQRWRFQVVSAQHVIVHFVTDHLDEAYAFDGRPLLLSMGCLLESLSIAASRYRHELTWHHRPQPGGVGTLALVFCPNPGLPTDNLHAYLIPRVSDRRRYALTPLTPAQKQALEEAAGNTLEIRWFETLSDRWQMGRLGSLANAITMTIPEAYAVHQRIIDWEQPLSPDRLPVQSLGGAAPSVRLFRWIMASATRHRLCLATLPGATWSARWELNLVPAIFSAAHFILALKSPVANPDDPLTLIQAGRSLQRFWLRATQLGLAMSPNYACVVMAHHGRHQSAFTQSSRARGFAKNLSARFTRAAQEHGLWSESVVFTGRIGTPPRAALDSRAVRLPLESLLWQGSHSKVQGTHIGNGIGPIGIDTHTCSSPDATRSDHSAYTFQAG